MGNVPSNRDRQGFRGAIAATLLLLGLTVGSCLPASAFDAEATKFYEDAVKRLEKDDVPGAIIQLNNALQKDPGMLAAHVLLGKTRLRNADPAGAELSLEAALKLGVDRAEVTLLLAQAYSAQGKYDVLLERITPGGLPRQTQVEILVLRGNAQAESADLAGAMRSFEDALALDPRSIAAQLARANALVRTGQLPRAATLANEIVKSAPNESAAWTLRASVEHLKGNAPAALADYTKAISLDSGNLDARAAQAGLLLDVGRLEEADRAVADLQSASPRDPRGSYLRAVVASRKNDPDAERKALTDAVGLIDPAPKKVVSRYGQLLLVAGLSHYGLGNGEKAADYLAIYVKQNPRHVGPSKLLASIYLDRGDTARALGLLEPLQASAQSDPQFLSLLAAAYMADRRYSQAAPLLERAVKVSSGAPDLRSDFGVSLIASGQAELGYGQLQQALAKDPGQAHAGVLLTTWYLKRGQPKKALEVIDSVVRRDPRNVHATNLLGVVRVATGDRAGSRAAYEKALALDPRYQPALLNLVRLDVAEGKSEAARIRLTQMLKTNPNDGDAMFEFALLEEQARRPAEAIAWLEKARAIPRHRVNAGIYLTDLLIRQREFVRAVKIAKEVVSREPKDFRALFALTRAELAVGDSRGARQTLSVMSPLAGFDPDKNVEIARLQFAAGDRENAMYSLDKVLKSNADHPAALALLAEAEIASGDYVKAEQHARRVAERFPAQGIGPRLLGDLALVRNQFPAAITNYRAALAKEKNTDTALRLYRAHVLAGDPAKGLVFLDQWSRDNPDDLVALGVLADEYLRTGNVVAARSTYERLLQRNPENVGALNNLAQVAMRQGDKAALGYAERAYQLEKGDTAIIDTLGWALVRQGQLDRGIGLLRDARLRDASNPEIRYHLAAALAKAGREAEARSELKGILKDGVAFYELDDARKLETQLGR